MRGSVAAGVLMLAVGGCASSGGGPQLSPAARLAADAPPNYKALVAARLRETLKDPYSVREAGISAPFLGVEGLIWGERTLVCIRMNGKNSFGAYTGLKYGVAAFKDGRVTGIAESSVMACDSSKVYEPFPELGSTT